ncbi:MAG: cellulase family glycosylhydrolase [Lachnospiraceae bacterium]|nr:cellulase family glycosylhydrolase [Lachnospiraceae bacterium]
MDKTKKILIGVCAVLTLVVVGLVGYLIGSSKSKDGNSGTTTEAAQSTTAAAQSTEAPATETTTEKKSEASSETTQATTEAKAENKTEETGGTTTATGDTYAVLTLANNWESGSLKCGQFALRVVNGEKEPLKNWKVEIGLPEGAKLDNGWNGDYKEEGGKLIIEAVDYNNEINAGSSLSDVGFIVSCKSEAGIRQMPDDVKLYVGGKEVKADSSAKKTTESAEAEKKPAPKTETGTPLENHGRLKISGTDIVDKNGDKYQLKGVSTHGLAWFPTFVNKEAFKTIRDDWGGNLIRLAMYTDEGGGYCTDGDKEALKRLVENGVDYATELGMYVIIDWHILHDLSPQTYKPEALKFFEEMASKYADYENVLFEICNEPNGGTTWDDVKSYAEEVIPVIRKYSQNIVIVGTPTWSQDLDKAAENPLKMDNVCYALHFYAATHKGWLRDKVYAARNAGLPVFISEFSICDASGNGGIDYYEADDWFYMIDELNLSYAAWNLANKDETSSLIKSSCEKTSDWNESELSDTGVWIRSKMRGD